MPGIRAVSSALAVAACAAALAACGGDDEGGSIPEDQGQTLLDLLDQVDSQVSEGLCDDAQQTAVAFGEQVNTLPSAVDGELRNALVRASTSLEALTQEQCEERVTGPSGETDTVPPETDTPETPAPTTTDETTTEGPPPEDESDGGNGPPADTPGNGDPGGGNGGGGEGDDGSSGGIGSDG